MHENTWGRVTFLVTLMFCRIEKFDRHVFRGWGAYISDVNWVTNLGGVYLGGTYVRCRLLMGFYSIICITSMICGWALFSGLQAVVGYWFCMCDNRFWCFYKKSHQRRGIKSEYGTSLKIVWEVFFSMKSESLLPKLGGLACL